MIALTMLRRYTRRGSTVSFTEAYRTLPATISVADHRWDPVFLDDVRHGRRRHAMAEILQRTLDSRVTQLGFSVAMRTTRPRISARTVGRPSRRFGYVRCRAVSSRCQRRSVSGRTMLATSVRIRRPSNTPRSARRRRSASDRRTRRPCSCAIRTRFSALRYSITPCCSPAIRRTNARQHHMQREYTPESTGIDARRRFWTVGALYEA